MEHKTENPDEQEIKKMTDMNLDKCLTADHPEMARNNNDDEPCDDNRS